VSTLTAYCNVCSIVSTWTAYCSVCSIASTCTAYCNAESRFYRESTRQQAVILSCIHPLHSLFTWIPLFLQYTTF